MQKIFLAISNQKELSIIKSELKKRDATLVVEEIQDIEGIKTALSKSFDLLIVDHTILPDINAIDITNVNGMIWYVNPRFNEHFAKQDEVVSYFNTYSNVRTKVIYLSYGNHDITKKKPKSKNKTQTNHILKADDSQEKIFIQNTTITDSKSQKTNVKSDTKEDHQVNPSDLEETLDLDEEGGYQSFEDPPYPDIEKTVLEKIKSDSDKLKFNNNIPDEQDKSKEKYQSLIIRAAKLSEDIYLDEISECNKTIGIWSPIRNMGVTTIVINFAIFLGKMNLPVTVVEAITKNQAIKDILRDYGSKKPKNWCSFIKAMNDESILPEQLRWNYKGAKWLPLDVNDDQTYRWNKVLIELLLNHAKNLNKIRPFNLVLVDLPTGEMAQPTLDTLPHLDEIWILLDINERRTLTWHNYILSMLEKYDLQGRLLFRRELTPHYGVDYKRIVINRISKRLNLPILAEIPHIQSEFENHIVFSRKPLIEYGNAQRLLEKAFDNIGKEILGEYYVKKQQEPLLSKFLTLFKTQT